MRSIRSKGLATLLLMAGAPAMATVVIAHTLEDMARAAPLIVHARVGQSQAAWDDGHAHIDTFTEMAVLDALKGTVAQGSALMVREPGGEVGKQGMHVNGAARFTPGEEVVLFLEPAPDDPRVYLTWGLAAGKVTLGDNGLGQVRALRDLSGLSFLGKGQPRPALQVIKPIEDFGSPEQFTARLKRAIGGAR